MSTWLRSSLPMSTCNLWRTTLRQWREGYSCGTSPVPCRIWGTSRYCGLTTTCPICADIYTKLWNLSSILSPGLKQMALCLDKPGKVLSSTTGGKTNDAGTSGWVYTHFYNSYAVWVHFASEEELAMAESRAQATGVRG